MVATVQVGEKNGTSGTFTDKTSGTIRCKNADNATVDTSDPMVIPTSGSDWSIEKYTRLKITVAPDTSISNLKFYTDGGNGFGTGVLLWAAASTQYAQPVTASSSRLSSVDAFTYTSGSALDLGTAASSSTGERGAHAVLGLEVSSSATQGSLTAETMTYSYDEI